MVREHALDGDESARRLLTACGEAWDRAQQARAVLAEHGTTYLDRWDQPKARPEVAIERDARAQFARLLEQLGLRRDARDDEDDEEHDQAGL